MRDEKEERKKQARSNKQTRQSNTAHPRQSFFLENLHVHVWLVALCRKTTDLLHAVHEFSVVHFLVPFSSSFDLQELFIGRLQTHSQIHHLTVENCRGERMELGRRGKGMKGGSEDEREEEMSQWSINTLNA